PVDGADALAGGELDIEDPRAPLRAVEAVRDEGEHLVDGTPDRDRALRGWHRRPSCLACPPMVSIRRTLAGDVDKTCVPRIPSRGRTGTALARLHRGFTAASLRLHRDEDRTIRSRPKRLEVVPARDELHLESGLHGE